MFSERQVRITLTLPKVEGNLKWDLENQSQTSRSRIISINSRPQQNSNRNHKHALTSIASPKQLQLYTPMQESKRAKRLKNIPYQLECFTPNLPNKNFKSSHLMSEDLLKPQGEIIENKNKWQLRTHITRTNNVFSLCQLKRLEQQGKNNEQNDELKGLRKLNQKNIEHEKVKRYQKYKQATQNLIDQFARQFKQRAKVENLSLNL